ncbi:LPO_1073/Vpar_1526 family protein [Agromyces arachidis]|uniref:LPO_1073/Vpar_1526 family protein n=1 Tax=Agromyces arachidis TaxID=766966 RepID=UPI00405657F6
MQFGGQGQNAGDNAVQIQVHGDLQMGITEERAREIAWEQARSVVDEFAAESAAIIEARLVDFDRRSIDALSQEALLGSFADPAFVRAYRKAQEGAASSERPDDYDLLSAMLVERAKNPSNRPIRTAVERAVEVVDRIDDLALRALTVLVAVQTYTPSTGWIMAGLDVMDGLMQKLLDGPLPDGAEWIDHLDLLDALRVNPIGSLKGFDEYYSKQTIGYVAPGVAAEEAPARLTGDFGTAEWGNLIVDHELKPGFVRAAFVSEGKMREILGRPEIPSDLAEAYISEAKSVFGLGEVDPIALEAFGRSVRDRPSLGRVADWYNAIPQGIQTTAVGRTLARANAYRLDTAGQLPREEP